MRSRANFRSHPIHPMLIPFPLALLIGALVADLGGYLLGLPDLWIAGWYLLAGGILMGLLAAVPGLIDYLGTVPPESSGKERATKHMLANVGALVLFAAAWWLRGDPGASPGAALLGIEAVGAGLLGIGGWLGGTLVFRNQIGVDHRYAGAGKWEEQKVSGKAGESVVVATADELEVDQMKLLHVRGRRIVLARTEDGYVAFSDHCTHKGGSLAGGVMACGRVVCPWHGSQFDARTGEVRAGPADQPIPTYTVTRDGDEVRLTLP
jgi:nitrite reductase/ring-hydroxylating ferredoxin subunit/uncharacterized membrane protein